MENLKERGRLEDLGIDERVVLKCISKTRCEGVDVIYLVQFRYREDGNEPVGPIKCGGAS